MPDEPSVPKPGEPGYGDRYKSTDHRSVLNDGTRADREHVIPGAQLQALTHDPASGLSDYRNGGHEYKHDYAVANPTSNAHDKTHVDGTVPSDNHRTAEIKQLQHEAWTERGDGAQLNRDLIEPSVKHAAETGMSHQAAARGALEQAGSLFGLHRLDDSGAAAAYHDHVISSRKLDSDAMHIGAGAGAMTPLGAFDALGLGRDLDEFIRGGLGLDLEARNKYFSLTPEQFNRLLHDQEHARVQAIIAHEAALRGMSPDEYRKAFEQWYKEHPDSHPTAGQTELWDPSQREQMLHGAPTHNEPPDSAVGDGGMSGHGTGGTGGVSKLGSDGFEGRSSSPSGNQTSVEGGMSSLKAASASGSAPVSSVSPPPHASPSVAYSFDPGHHNDAAPHTAAGPIFSPDTHADTSTDGPSDHLAANSHPPSIVDHSSTDVGDSTPSPDYSLISVDQTSITTDHTASNTCHPH